MSVSGSSALPLRESARVEEGTEKEGWIGGGELEEALCMEGVMSVSFSVEKRCGEGKSVVLDAMAVRLIPDEEVKSPSEYAINTSLKSCERYFS